MWNWPYHDGLPTVRTTTLVFEDDTMECITDDANTIAAEECDNASWTKSRPWCGQTTFVFPRVKAERWRKTTPAPAPCKVSGGASEPTTNSGNGDATAEAGRDGMLFSPHTERRPQSGACDICARVETVATCPCCPNAVAVCGANCLLKHVEGRYDAGLGRRCQC